MTEFENRVREKADSVGITMSELATRCGYSRQGFYAAINRIGKQEEKIDKVLAAMQTVKD